MLVSFPLSASCHLQSFLHPTDNTWIAQVARVCQTVFRFSPSFLWQRPLPGLLFLVIFALLQLKTSYSIVPTATSI